MQMSSVATFVLVLAVATSFEYSEQHDSVVPEGGLNHFQSSMAQVSASEAEDAAATEMIQDYMRGCDYHLPASEIQSLRHSEFKKAVSDVTRLTQMNAGCSLVANLVEKVDNGQFTLEEVAQELDQHARSSDGVKALHGKLMSAHVDELLDTDDSWWWKKKKKAHHHHGKKKTKKCGWFCKLKKKGMALKKHAVRAAKVVGKRALKYALKQAKKFICSKLEEAEGTVGDKVDMLKNVICSKLPPKLARLPMAVPLCKKAIAKAAAHGIGGLNKMCGFSEGRMPAAPAAQAWPAAAPAAYTPAAPVPAAEPAHLPAAEPASGTPLGAADAAAHEEEQKQEDVAKIAGAEATLKVLDEDVEQKRVQLENEGAATELDDRMLDVLLQRY
eukprot:TRINITY_DN8871_c0_g1_i1.p1 TRINITY_DN8871_c0_g1~~TRINITY_DN8871_c0_g1_i1.p1  ORF type:complete len:386 (+),score=138.49 TRINITY_DN8871_c0_g1_i1:190-1347(+)